MPRQHTTYRCLLVDILADCTLVGCNHNRLVVGHSCTALGCSCSTQIDHSRVVPRSSQDIGSVDIDRTGRIVRTGIAGRRSGRSHLGCNRFDLWVIEINRTKILVLGIIFVMK